METGRVVRNEDIVEIRMEIPGGHRHLRTTLVFKDGSSIVLQEATVANLVRAFVTVKTHPVKTRLVLAGRHLERRKAEFAEWQLIEIDEIPGAGEEIAAGEVDRGNVTC